MFRGVWQSAIHWFELVFNTPENLDLDLQVRSKKKKNSLWAAISKKTWPWCIVTPVYEPGVPLAT